MQKIWTTTHLPTEEHFEKHRPHKNKDKGVVECSEVYIGETGRPLKIRITKHQRAVEKGDMKNANAVHKDVMNHKINWRKSEVVDRERRTKREE